MARPPRVQPRLSAAQLADYLAATSPIAQMAITAELMGISGVAPGAGANL